MKISDVLWEAAQNLPRYKKEFGSVLQSSQYSCDQIKFACGISLNAATWYSSTWEKAREFLQSFGVCEDGIHQFNEFDEGPQRQQARYNWLMFAYEIALEEGL